MTDDADDIDAENIARDAEAAQAAEAAAAAAARDPKAQRVTFEFGAQIKKLCRLFPVWAVHTLIPHLPDLYTSTTIRTPL